MHLVTYYVIGGLTGWLSRRGGKIVTQTQLNRSYAPPESDFAARYGRGNTPMYSHARIA